MVYKAQKRTRSVRPRTTLLRLVLVLIVLVVGASASYVAIMRYNTSTKKSQTNTQKQTTENKRGDASQFVSPLKEITLYSDPNSSVARATKGLEENGKTAEASTLKIVAEQPTTIWLVGPSASDPQANRDIEKVQLTSKEAQAQNKTVVYQLYAIPKRDACAGYSMGGFKSASEYQAWVQRIVASLSSKAIILLETDSISQTIRSSCLNASEISERYTLLSQAVDTLKASQNVVGVYLDGGHSEWFPDSSVLVEPLKNSGIDRANGIAVNVAFFVKTDVVTAWAQELARRINDSAGVVIDTSRNGNGAPNNSITGDNRWCNPAGRRIGPTPTTSPSDDRIHAYLWVKNIGESDGACNGFPDAGTFVTDIALSLITNSQE